MLQKLIDDAKPEYLVVAYDSKEPSFRKQRYAEYKANRAAPPDDLIPQFDRIDQLIRLMDIHSFRVPGVEADDLIGTLANRWFELSDRHEVVIVSGDKDLMQIVTDRITLLDTMKGKTSGIPEVVDDERTGRLVPPGDPVALAAVIVALLSDAPARARMASAARDAVQARFSVDRMVDATVDAYAQLADRPHAADTANPPDRG